MNTDMRLINGDCLDYLESIREVDLVVTSPPYYNAKEYSQYDSYDDYLKFLNDVFTKIFDSLNDGRMCCVNISPIIIPRKNRQSESRRLALPFHFVNLMENIGFKFLEDIIWVKPNASVPNRNGGFYRHRKPVAYKPNCITEYILVFQKPCDCLIDKIIHNYPDETVAQSIVDDEYEKTNVWHIKPETRVNHPAPFPLDIPYKLVKYYSFIEDIVLDPFMGSGTTGLVCKELNRSFIGIELNEEYYKIAEDRIRG